MEDTPGCKDFILTAVKETRANLSKLRAGLKSGVSVTRIWSLASNFYSEEEFRKGLNQLYSAGVLLIIWNIGRGVEGRDWHVQHDEIMEKIPPAMPLDSDRWCKEANGSSIIAYADILKTPVWKRDSINAVRLYIRDDNLPKKVSRLLVDEPNKRALEIMAKCKEQK